MQAEIVDETDIYEDVNRRVLRRGGARADVATFLTMFEHKLHASALSPAEVAAVAAFLQLNVDEFAPLMRYDLPLKVHDLSTLFSLISPWWFKIFYQHTSRIYL